MIESSDQKNEYNDEIENKIFTSFKKYIELVKSKFRDNHSKVKKHLSLYIDNKIKIEDLENGQEFSQLLDDTVKIESPFVKTQPFWKNNKGAWKDAIKNFFRRSSCYLNIINKEDIDFELLFGDYLKSFRKEKTQVAYFAIIESVYFSKKTMDFGSFKIRRFSVLELDTVFNRTINEIFYPFAIIDSKRLQDYWFICVTDNEIFTEYYFDLDLNKVNIVKFDHSNFTKPVELALKKFSLFDWQLDFTRDSDEKHKLWIAPEIPYVFKVNDTLLGEPSRINFDYNQLQTEPYFHPHTNEEIDEKPQIFIHLDDKETEKFEKFTLNIEHVFNMIFQKKIELNFIDIALGYFIKAFLSQGMEQLLWHISTIEALLGEKAEGLTNRLARRSALIIAKEREDREIIRKKFKELYDFRSKLVHGNPFSNNKKKSLYVGHLFNARDISRRIILWFLYFISNNIQGTDKQKSSLTQQNILTTIDLEPEKIFNNIAT